MTVDDLRRMTDDYITPATAADVMRMDVSRVIGYAREGRLPFPVIVSGNRVKISRKGFLAWHDGGKQETKTTDREQLNLITEKLTALFKEVKILSTMAMALLVDTAPDIAERIIDELEKKGALQ